MKKTPPKIDSRNARLKLEKRGKPYWWPVASGIYLGYRAGPGTWNVRAANGVGGNWIRCLDAIADDHEEADDVKVLSFDQASAKARTMARGTDANATGAPITVDQALVDYRQDLIANGQPTINESHPRHHLTPALLVRLVSQLTARELKTWRNSLVAKGVKASTINRMCKGLKAALNQTAEHDDRIKNVKAWGGKSGGLAALPEDDDTESNIVLEEGQRHGVVAAAYEISLAFGLYVEVHAATGARSDQIARINVGDLQTGDKPLLMVPPSKKGGKKRKTRGKKPMPISASLARRLKQAAAGRAATQPLLVHPGSGRWDANKHRRPFQHAAKVAELPDGATIYCLRHTAITRALLANVPVRLVASSFDTSVAMIEKTYSKYISDHGDEQMRKTVFDVDMPSGDNVVPIKVR